MDDLEKLEEELEKATLELSQLGIKYSEKHNEFRKLLFKWKSWKHKKGENNDMVRKI